MTKPKWHQNVWVVLLLLLFVLGPLGLPLVWKNPKFSRPEKILLTLLMAAYTVVLIKMTARLVRSVQTSFESLNSVLQY